VNAGASEVAKVFLNQEKMQTDIKEYNNKITNIISSETKSKEHSYQLKVLDLQNELTSYQQLTHKLKVTLINFLQYSRLLLLKCRNILITENLLQPFNERSRIIERSFMTNNYLINGGTMNDMNELMLLTYPSILNSLTNLNMSNPLQSVNLNGVLGGGGGGNIRSSVVGSSITGLPNLNTNPSGNNPLATSVSPSSLGGLWRTNNPNFASAESTSNRDYSFHPSSSNAGGGGGANAGNQNTQSMGSTTSNGSHINPGTTGNSNPNLITGSQNQVALTAQEINNLKWQMEMEKGFDNLAQTIYPYISDLKEAEMFYLPAAKSAPGSSKDIHI
jgi:hypothetical protein